MAAAIGTLERYSTNGTSKIANIPAVLGSWISGMFGCAHKELSRPFSRHGEGYRVCIACGARRQFDDKTWNSAGRFYYKPANTNELLDVDCTALRSL